MKDMQRDAEILRNHEAECAMQTAETIYKERRDRLIFAWLRLNVLEKRLSDRQRAMERHRWITTPKLKQAKH
jgi:hypothetical protein